MPSLAESCSCLAFSVPLSSVRVLRPLAGSFLSRVMIASLVSAAPFRGSLVISTRRLLRSTSVFKAALLFREMRLSPSQWPQRRRFSTDFGRASIEILLGILVFLTFLDRKSTRLNSSHQLISYAVFCLK